MCVFRVVTPKMACVSRIFNLLLLFQLYTVVLADSCGADPGYSWPKSGSWVQRLPTTCLRVNAAVGRLILDVPGALSGVRAKVGPKMNFCGSSPCFPRAGGYDPPRAGQ